MCITALTGTCKQNLLCHLIRINLQQNHEQHELYSGYPDDKAPAGENIIQQKLIQRFNFLKVRDVHFIVQTV